MTTRFFRHLTVLGLATALAAPTIAAPTVGPPAGKELPNVLWITIDALRPDRLSGYGYRRPTSPNIDRLLAGGARFDAARTVEPLTSPALSSMITSLYPHEHGGTRNGLRMRPGLPSLPRQLKAHGYQTAAFVGNWTLKNRISGLGEHFDLYKPVLTRKRWLGLFKGEATAEDLTSAALDWLAAHGGRRRPFLLWVHYVEPHAPYLLHPDEARRLGISTRGSVSKSDRYDTEIAFVDRSVGRLVDYVENDPRLAARTLVVFAADHGESLGEHSYWGHGRNLYAQGLRIPMALYWPGHLGARTVSEPALLIDLAPTIASLVGVPPLETDRGFDWSGVLLGKGEPPHDRELHFQAHKGAVLSQREAADARRWGLLEVGLLRGSSKELCDVSGSHHHCRIYDLSRDPTEAAAGAQTEAAPSHDLEVWLAKVENGLNAASDAPPPALDPEALKRLQALGYSN